MTELKESQSKYEFSLLVPNDIDLVYRDLYCENNSVLDEFIGENRILPIDKYDKIEFTELLNDKNNYSFVTVEKIFLKSPNTPNYYYVNEKKGFVCFSANRSLKTINVLLFEAKNHKLDIYDILAKGLVAKIIAKNEEKGRDQILFNKVSFEIEDGHWNKMKALINNGFTKTKTLSKVDFPDSYRYEKSLCLSV